jgi:hypothetical protein
MINVNQITSQLAKMPDQALQQYAAMHKNDPYTVSLALAEANRRKEMRAGAQMQAAPQPKVVDQDIAQMVAPTQVPAAVAQRYSAVPGVNPAKAAGLPEEVGIGALSADNLKGMAGGGIVAFEEGGEVPRFADGGSWISRLPEDAWLRRLMESYQQGRAPLDIAPAPYPQTLPAAPAAAAPAAAIPAAAPAGGRADLTADSTSAYKGAGTSGAAGQVPPAPPVAPAAVRAPGIAALNTKPLTAAEAKNMAGEFVDPTALNAAIANARVSAEDANKGIESSYKEGIAALPEAYKDYEAKLRQQETDAATDKDKAMGMSIFKAGLAMMAGTSRNAFENIGKGALVGAEDYQSAIKDFKKAQLERDRALADIENARLAFKRDDIKTATSLQEKAADRLAKVDDKSIEATSKLLGVNAETASGIYRVGMTEAGANQRALLQEQGANARAAMEPGEIRGLRALMADPRLLETAGKLAAAKTEPRSVEAHKSEWAKSYVLQSKYPNVEDYIRMMTGTPAAGGGSDGFKVLGSRPAP